MGDNSASNGNIDVVLNVNDDATKKCDDSSIQDCVPMLQKLVAEVVGTFLLIFAGCGSVVTNLNNGGVTIPGIAMVWGLAVMGLAYSLGHISGAHFNPAVTIAHASAKRFPLKQVPAYIIAQLVGSTLASATLRLIFSGTEDQFFGTFPTGGSDLQAFVVEFIITFFLMFIISGVATDNRAIGELAGLAIGSAITLNVLFAGPITGASMNPARSLGPAIVHNVYKGIWIYLVAPILGALAGTWAYTFIR